MDSKLRFPDKINKPRMFRGRYIDQITFTACASLVAYVFFAFTIGDLHSFIGPLYMGVLSWFGYGYAQKKMKRGYIYHWFWTRGQINIKPQKKHLDNLPADFLPKGYECEFRD